MDVNGEIASWILDFLIWQPMENRKIKDVIRALPLPDDPRLQKSLLLRKLAADASRRSISETTLDSLELLEEIEFRRRNVAVPDAMKRAYCLAAVDCTMKLLTTGDGSDVEKKSKFSEMVARLWMGRIGRIEEAAAGMVGGGLGSDLLWEWRDDIDAAVSDDGALERAVRKFEGVRAVEAVEDYVREERERMGPSFLESLAERLRRDAGLQNVLGVNRNYHVAGEEIELVGEEEAPLSDQ